MEVACPACYGSGHELTSPRQPWSRHARTSPRRPWRALALGHLLPRRPTTRLVPRPDLAPASQAIEAARRIRSSPFAILRASPDWVGGGGGASPRRGHDFMERGDINGGGEGAPVGRQGGGGGGRRRASRWGEAAAGPLWRSKWNPEPHGCSEHDPICHLFELILVIHANTSNGTNHIV
jgi:hypothetical protein